jgi:hypothetical protein
MHRSSLETACGRPREESRCSSPTARRSISTSIRRWTCRRPRSCGWPPGGRCSSCPERAILRLRPPRAIRSRRSPHRCARMVPANTASSRAGTQPKPSSPCCAERPASRPSAAPSRFAPESAASRPRTACRRFPSHSAPRASMPSTAGRPTGATSARPRRRRSISRATCRCTPPPSISSARGSTPRHMATCGIRLCPRAGGRTTTVIGQRFDRMAGHGSAPTSGHGRPTTTGGGATPADPGSGSPAARGRPRGCRGPLPRAT